MSNTKTTNILYWVFTGLFSLMMLLSSIPDIISDAASQEYFKNISLPNYLLPFLGWAKTAGVLVIIIPGFARLKEWAYAGLTFDLIGAMYCIAAGGNGSGECAIIFLPLAIGFLSYFYYRKKLRQKQ